MIAALVDLLALSGAAALAGILLAPLLARTTERLCADASPGAQTWFWRASLFAIAAPVLIGLVFSAVPLAASVAGAAKETAAPLGGTPPAGLLADGLAPLDAPLQGATFLQVIWLIQAGLAVVGGLAWLGALGGWAAAFRDRVRLAWVLERARPTQAPALTRLVSEWSRRFGVHRRTKVVVIPSGSPFLTGLRQPRIVLPAGLAQDVDSDALAHVIAHEMAHVRRGDELGRPLDNALSRLVWFNPAARRIADRLADAREAACDALVVGAAPALRRDYARTVLALAIGDGREPAAACAFPTANERTYTMRLNAILHAPSATPSTARRRSARRVALASVGVAVAGMLAACATAAAQQVSESDREEHGVVVLSSGGEQSVRVLEGPSSAVRVLHGETGAEGPLVGVDVLENEDGSRSVRITHPETGDVETIDIAPGAHGGHAASRVVIRSNDGEETYEWSSADVEAIGDLVRVDRETGVVFITDPETNEVRTFEIPEDGAEVSTEIFVIHGGDQAGPHE